MKYLIVGLGNIGAEYHNTRHNIGFMVLDELARKYEATFEQDRHSFSCQVKYKGRQLHLVKPTTFMNLSGKAVAYFLQHLKIPKENLLVIVDDLAIPFGALRMRGKGSSAGHNGLKNIEQLTGGQNYPRLRFGIGDDFSKGKQIDFVLSEFTKQECEELPFVIDKACDMILSFSFAGISQTMTAYNK